MAKLKQVCNHPPTSSATTPGCPAAPASSPGSRRCCEEVATDGDNGLGFTQFTELGEIIQPLFGREDRLRGAVPARWRGKEQRDRLVARFQEAAAVLFILSLKAGGTGSPDRRGTMSSTSTDGGTPPSKPGDRPGLPHRPAATCRCASSLCWYAGGADRRDDRGEAGAGRAVVGAGEGWLANLSTSELRDVVSLTADAVPE